MHSTLIGSTTVLVIAGTTLVALGVATSARSAGWTSGASRSGEAEPSEFAAWRGTPLGIAISWIQWRDGGWNRMYQYASGSDVRALRRNSSNVSLAEPLFPEGGSLTACANGQYNANHYEVARRLAANGVGDAEIRLGWEGNGDWYPWKAAGVNPETWKKCFVNAAKQFKAMSAKFRIAWHMNKKGRVDVRTLWPTAAANLITNICVSVYDDPWVRWGNETYMGGPHGLRAWLDFARSKNKRLCIGEWGVGNYGDNPEFVQKMYDFVTYAQGTGYFSHEAYWNRSWGRLYPTTSVPNSAKKYRELF